ncbi:vitamin K epoxide reductase family protein [Candidatus Gottesmanbacteria bacterium]|nr:vitamin K epoxide reductase family protein [Candidatus Gottesmanbacteria bacterium]
MEKKYNRAIFILSIAGLIIAIYVLQSFLRKSSIVCLNSGCELIRKSPYSYIFGIPVPGFGLAGYFFIMVLSFLRTIYNDRRLIYGMLGISTFGLAFVSWFTYTEIFTIRAICTWCAVSAFNMAIIFLLSVRTFLIGQKVSKSH